MQTTSENIINFVKDPPFIPYRHLLLHTWKHSQLSSKPTYTKTNVIGPIIGLFGTPIVGLKLLPYHICMGCVK